MTTRQHTRHATAEPHAGAEPGAFDPRRLQPAAAVVARLRPWFRPEVRGLERVPSGAALLVGNHSAGMVTPDSFFFLLEYYRRTGWREPVVILAHDALFRVPGLETVVRYLGCVPARAGGAAQAFSRGHKVLLYPGGDFEAARPRGARDVVCFGGRQGFVRLAMRQGVPIVPLVTAGAHDGWFVLTRGDRLARVTRLDRLLRVKIFPIALALPFGLVLGPLTLHVPAPERMLIEALEPIHLDGDPDDPVAVAQGYQRVTATMQQALTRLAGELRGR